MSLTEFGYCPKCDARRELVMTSAGVFACNVCDNLNIYSSKAEFEKMKEEAEDRE